MYIVQVFLYHQDQSSGYHYVDVKQLHRMMVADVNTLRGAGVAAHKQSLLEVELICSPSLRSLSPSFPPSLPLSLPPSLPLPFFLLPKENKTTSSFCRRYNQLSRSWYSATQYRRIVTAAVTSSRAGVSWLRSPSTLWSREGVEVVEGEEGEVGEVREE